MKHQRIIRFAALILLFICLFALDAWAGPHLRSMRFGKSIINSSWSKIIFFVLVGLAIPFILYGFTRRYFKAWSTLNALKKIAVNDPNFEWTTLKNRFTDVFTLMHLGWGQTNVVEVSANCTKGYLQDQQLVNLNHWKDEGLVKVSNLNKINRMAPILVRHSGHPQGENSIVVVDFKANVESYFTAKETGQIVHGKKGFQNEETIWTFQLNNGKWLLSNVEQVELRSVYINLTNETGKGIS